MAFLLYNSVSDSYFVLILIKFSHLVMSSIDDALQLPCSTATAVTLTPFHPANEKPCPSGVESIIIIIITSILTILMCAVIFLVWVAPLVSVLKVAQVMGQ